MIRQSLRAPSTKASTSTALLTAVVPALLVLCSVLSSATAQGEGVAAAAATPLASGVRPQCLGFLGWVPLLMKQPYSSLLNNAYCPSWTTRHMMTKQEQHTHLAVPRGVPLAVLCGLCHRPTKLENNVTLQQLAGGEDQLIAQVRAVQVIT